MLVNWFLINNIRLFVLCTYYSPSPVLAVLRTDVWSAGFLGRTAGVAMTVLKFRFIGIRLAFVVGMTPSLLFRIANKSQ